MMKLNVLIIFIFGLIFSYLVIVIPASSTEFRVNTYTTLDQTNPAVAYDGSNYFATWQSYQDGSSYGIYGQLVTTSGTLTGSEFRVNTYTTNLQAYPSVAYGGENYLVTWYSLQDGGTGGYGVYGQMVDKSGVLSGSEFRVNTYTTNSQANSAVASSGSNFLVTWTSYGQDGSGDGIYGQLVNSSGALSGPEFRVNTTIPGAQSNSAVAYGAGKYLVTWQSQDGNLDGIYGQFIDSSTGALSGSEFRVNTYTPAAQTIPAVASNGSNFLVTWTSNLQDGSDTGVFGQILDPSGALIGSGFQINTFTANDQNNSALTSYGTNYVVVWQSEQDGSNYGIYGQTVTSTGSLVGPETQINTYTSNAQMYPVAASDGTNVMVAWSSSLQDGYNTGVYADSVHPVPEPSAMVLFGLLGVPFLLGKRKKIS